VEVLMSKVSFSGAGKLVSFTCRLEGGGMFSVARSDKPYAELVLATANDVYVVDSLRLFKQTLAYFTDPICSGVTVPGDRYGQKLSMVKQTSTGMLTMVEILDKDKSVHIDIPADKAKLLALAITAGFDGLYPGQCLIADENGRALWTVGDKDGGLRARYSNPDGPELQADGQWPKHRATASGMYELCSTVPDGSGRCLKNYVACPLLESFLAWGRSWPDGVTDFGIKEHLL
jgi:hypothetical protein